MSERHRQAVAKLLSSNHKLRIETDRYHLPKIPESLRIYQLCSWNKVENEIHFLFECNLCKNLRQHFSQDVEAKYSKFVELNKSEKVVYFSNNINPCVFVNNLVTMQGSKLKLGFGSTCATRYKFLDAELNILGAQLIMLGASESKEKVKSLTVPRLFVIFSLLLLLQSCD